MTLESKYNLHQKVKIVELDVVGSVVCIEFGKYGVRYEVLYWWVGELKSVYMMEFDLVAA